MRVRPINIFPPPVRIEMLASCNFLPETSNRVFDLLGLDLQRYVFGKCPPGSRAVAGHTPPNAEARGVKCAHAGV